MLAVFLRMHFYQYDQRMAISFCSFAFLLSRSSYNSIACLSFFISKGKNFPFIFLIWSAEDQFTHPACSVSFCRCLFICFIERPATRKW